MRMAAAIPAAALAALLFVVGLARAQQARTLSLQEARRLAVAGTENVAAARATQRRARAQVRAARSAFFPQIGAAAATSDRSSRSSRACSTRRWEGWGAR